MNSLEVKILSGCSLVNKDYQCASEPYCEVRVGDQKYRTKALSGPNPTWNESFKVCLESKDKPVQVIVFDNKRSAEDSIGYFVLNLGHLANAKPASQSYGLQQAPFGTIQVELTLHDTDAVCEIPTPTAVPQIVTTHPDVAPETYDKNLEESGHEMPSLRRFGKKQHFGRGRNCSTPNETLFDF